MKRRDVPVTLLELDHPVPDRPDPLIISGRGVVSSDWHVPLISHDIASRMCQDAIDYNCTDFLVIAGDLLNLDALSDYLPKQSDAGLMVETDHAESVLELMLRVFRVIYITKGNHDVRAQRKLDYRTTFERSMRMLLPNLGDAFFKKKIIITDDDYLIVDSPAGAWHVAHTNQYSKIPLSVPRELCSILLMHVAAAHRHHHAIGMDKSGKFYAVELGGLFDTPKTGYLRQYTTTFPRWVPGYMLLADGVPYLPLLAPAP